MSRAWVIVIAAIAVCTWGYGGENLLFVAPAAILALIAFAGVADSSALNEFAFRIRGQSWCVAAGAMAVVSLAILPISANRYIASVECAWALVLIAVFVVAVLVSARDAVFLVAGLVTIVTTYAVYGFFQQKGIADNSFWHNAHYASRFVNSAHFATVLAAATCLAAALVGHSGPRWTRVVGLVGIPLNLAGLIMTGARAVWIASVAVMLATGILMCLCRPAEGRRRSITPLVIAVLLIAGVAVGLAAAESAVGDRVRDLVSLRAAGVSQRLLLWREALALISENPFGVGAGGFGERYLQYAPASNRYIAYRAHNEILQLVAELGWIAVPLVFWFCVAAWRSARAACKASLSPLTVGMLAALGVCMLHSLVDFPLRLRANSLFFATLAGAWVALQAGPDTEGARAGGRLLSWACRITACLLALGWVAIGVSNRYAKNGLQELAIMEFDRALNELEQGQRWMPNDPEVAFARGRALYAKATFAPRPEKRVLLESASAAFQRAARTAPYRAETQVRLAWARQDLGDSRGAEAAFRLAITLDSSFGIWRYYYAEFLTKEQRYEDAAAAYRAGLELLEDSGRYTPRRIFARLYEASEDLEVVRAACPDTPRDQAELAKFIRSIE